MTMDANGSGVFEIMCASGGGSNEGNASYTSSVGSGGDGSEAKDEGSEHVPSTQSGIATAMPELTAIVILEGTVRTSSAKTVLKRIMRAVNASRTIGRVVIATEEENVKRVADQLGILALLVERSAAIGRFELVSRGALYAEQHFGACEYVAILGTDFGPQHTALVESMLSRTKERGLDSLVATRTARSASSIGGGQSSAMPTSFLVFELACITRASLVREGVYVGANFETCDSRAILVCGAGSSSSGEGSRVA